jgi:hypothetical protein
VVDVFALSDQGPRHAPRLACRPQIAAS